MPPLVAPPKFTECPWCRGSGRQYTGLFLRTVRLDAGISLQRLAKRIGCSVSYLSLVERGTCRATTKLAEHYFAVAESTRP